jgi:hypothetical protein
VSRPIPFLPSCPTIFLPLLCVLFSAKNFGVCKMTQSNIKYVKWSCLDIVSLCSLLQCVVTYSSTYVLVALSIDRYDAITHPMNFSGSCKFISQFYYSEKYRDNAHIKHSAHLCFNFLRKTTKLSSVNIIWRSARIVNYFRNLS